MQLESSKLIVEFHIEVQAVDTISENEIKKWTVKRRDQDFYTLKAKLIEFHGENELADISLPSRRYNSFTYLNLVFIFSGNFHNTYLNFTEIQERWNIEKQNMKNSFKSFS